MFLADAHADSLMWNRDLNVRSRRGQVDFPRLREAGVGLQCFTVVTEGFPAVDGFSLFAWLRGWPRAARQDCWERATFQLDALERACAASGGTAVLPRTPEALTAALEEGKLCAILGVEGAHALEGDATRVRVLHARGVRFMGLTHLRDNALGGTSHWGAAGGGLTPLGRQVAEEMASVGMAVDLAHASSRLTADLLARPGLRPFCSHTGMAALASPWRNLSDATLRAVAERGGVVGVIYGTVYLGARTLDAVVRHIEHGLNVMGEDGVALGSDFDGMVPLPRGMRDVTDVPKLVEALAARGHPARVVEKVAGLNLRRFFTT